MLGGAELNPDVKSSRAARPTKTGAPAGRKRSIVKKDKSADSSFSMDLKAIRDHARSHIEEGAVTADYKGDKKTILKLLNDSLATEIVCVLRYKRHYFMSSNLGGIGG